MKHITTILSVLLLVAFTLFACNAQPTESQMPKTSDPSKSISIPEFFSDMGKTLNALKVEHPTGEIFSQNSGLPEAAAICYGEPEGEYAYYFFETQDGDAETAMNILGEQLKCAGFLTIAGVLFPEMEEEMSFSDFFSLIGVSDFEYFTEEEPAKGWLYFKHNNMDVLLNTNEINPKGGREFTGIEIVKSSAPVAISDQKISEENYILAHEVMYE